MKPLHGGASHGAVLTLLILLASLGAVVTPDARAQEPAVQNGEVGDERRADSDQRVRRQPPETAGTPASPGAMRAGRLDCEQVISRSTTLTADVGPCPGDGIIIGADNIVLNLNGHTISGTPGPGDGNAAGIRLPFRSGVTVTGRPGRSGKTGTVTGFDAGVVINGGSGNTVSHLIARDNIGPDDAATAELGDGIVLFSSGNNRIINNAVARNGIYDGIGVLGEGSNDNAIEGNAVQDNVNSSSDFAFPGEGAGIILTPVIDGLIPSAPSLTGNRITGNRVVRNDGPGISNRSSVDGVIARNTSEANGFGATADGHGIGVSANQEATKSTRVLVEQNQVHGNAFSGIQVLTLDNRIIRNDAADNVQGSFRIGFDLADFSLSSRICRTEPCGPPPAFDCDGNEWFGNTWGSGGYAPECTTVGGSGPAFEPPAEEPPPEEDPPPSDGP